jgi:hypothetical protein
MLGTQKCVNIPTPFISNLPAVTERDRVDLEVQRLLYFLVQLIPSDKMI